MRSTAAASCLRRCVASSQHRFFNFNNKSARGAYQTDSDYKQGFYEDANGMINVGPRENVARGRYVDRSEEAAAKRPDFDFMGRLQEWAREKACAHDELNYWYLDYLTDMEGYPRDIHDFKVPLTEQEHLNLRLWSHAEERKFWKCYYYYHSMYEFETEDNMDVYQPGKYDCLEYGMRAAGLGSPALFKAIQSSGIDDHTMIGLSLTQSYSNTNFNDDILNMLDGHVLYEVIQRAGFQDVTREHVRSILLHVLTLKIIPVEVLDLAGNVVSRKEFTYEEIPTLQHIPEAFGLEGGTTGWFIDVRNFYSTPGRMVSCRPGRQRERSSNRRERKNTAVREAPERSKCSM
eukprot:TRINITY_DN10515_c0_g1_i1.p1 TRINITY_DN10515_c0_g1~~TRINITY_DN10515_c0_g1_i1.p1  ORF type:complete len:347 (+),score=104.21 TRINITY_DN10515_c0_g1_i1:99-1139(+)